MFQMGRRCQKGKPCGATCIERKDNCLKDTAQKVASSLSSTRDLVENRKSSPYTLSPSVKAKSYSVGVAAQQTARVILQGLQDEGSIRKLDGAIKESKVNWKAVMSSGITYVGGGEYGSFVTVKPGDLIQGDTKGLTRTGVKTGKIGRNEIEALRIAGDNGVGPRFIAARASNRVERDFDDNPVYRGAIAMTRVGAIPYVKAKEMWGQDSKSDLLWQAAATLHKLGIAHNDMHGKNVYLSADGKAYFVDFGLAQISPKAALVEAVGAIIGGNWQFSGKRFEGHGITARDNLWNVRNFLMGKGFLLEEVDEMLESGIRTKDEDFTKGVWGRLSDKDAKKAIEIFYEGIGG